MRSSTDSLAFLVEDVLGVTPEQCLALAREARDEGDLATARHALLERDRFRAAVSGVLSGLRSSPRAALISSLLEERAHLRRSAVTRGALWALSDPGFFDRPSWPRRVLGLPHDAPWRSLLLREAARFGLRWVLVRAGRSAGDALPDPLGAMLGGLTGAGFNAVEDALEASLLEQSFEAPPPELEARSPSMAER